MSLQKLPNFWAFLVLLNLLFPLPAFTVEAPKQDPFRLNARWSELKESEAYIDKMRQRLIDHHYTAQDILENSDDSDYLVRADFAQELFQEKLDEHIQRQFDFFLMATHLLATSLRDSLIDKKIEKAFLNLETRYDAFLKYKDKLGEPDSWRRSQSIKSYFEGAKQFIDTFVALDTGDATKKSFFKKTLNQMSFYLKAAVMLSPELINFSWQLLRNKQPKAGYSPLIASINRTIRKFGRLLGYSVEIIGKENIPDLSISDSSKSVYIFTPTHRDGVLDGIDMAGLGTDDFMVFSASDNVFPKPLANLLDRSHSVIVVGRGSGKPFAKVLEKLKAGISRSIIIYPEGTLPGGMMETQPLRENFVKNLIIGLRAEGFKVNLVPVTNLNSGRFLRNYETPDQKKQKVVIHPPIQGSVLDALIATGDPLSINRLLRAIWLETLHTDSLFLMGQLRAETFKDALGGLFLQDLSSAKSLINRYFDHLETQNNTDEILFKTRTQTFTHQYELKINHGKIWIKSKQKFPEQKWELLNGIGLPTNSHFWDGFETPRTINQISADGDNLIAVSDEGFIYYMKFGTFIWTNLWGKQLSPFKPLNYFGDKLKQLVPNRAFAISHRGQFTKGYKDIHGNKQKVGPGVTTLYVLSDDGLHLYYTDPWLPPNYDREIPLPDRGRFRALSMTASASTLFVINAKGEMYTRLADFDTLGFNPFLKYSYRGNFHEEGNPRSLPGEPWVKQPPVPGRVTEHITIFQTGPWNESRELRVRGMDQEGNGGYFRKSINDTEWEFVQTGVIPFQVELLGEKDPFASQDLGPVLDENFKLKIGDTLIEVVDLNPIEFSAIFRITIDGIGHDLPLHTRRTKWDVSGPAHLWKATLVIPENIENLKLQSVLANLFGNKKEVRLSLRLLTSKGLSKNQLKIRYGLCQSLLLGKR